MTWTITHPNGTVETITDEEFSARCIEKGKRERAEYDKALAEGKSINLPEAKALNLRNQIMRENLPMHQEQIKMLRSGIPEDLLPWDRDGNCDRHY